MFFMARRAIRRENLIGVMNRAVMARFAALIVGVGTERASFLNMAGVALVGEDGVRLRNPTTTVDVIVASHREPTQPYNCDQWRRDR